MRFPCLLTKATHHSFQSHTYLSPRSNWSLNLSLHLSPDMSLSPLPPVFFLNSSTSPPPRIGPLSLFITKHHRPHQPFPLSLPSPSVVHVWKTSHYYSQSPLASPRRTRIKSTAAVGYLTRNSCHWSFNGGNLFHYQAFRNGCLCRSRMEYRMKYSCWNQRALKNL